MEDKEFCVPKIGGFLFSANNKRGDAGLQECKKRGLKVVVAGIPKTIDNDIDVRHFLLNITHLRGRILY